MVEEISHKINVLEVCSDLRYGGGQRNMVTFAKYLRKDIFSVSICAYGEGGPLELLIQSHNIPFLVARNEVARVLDFIRDKKIDIIHIHRSGGYVPIETEIIKGAKKINPKIIVIEKNVFGKYDPSTKGLIDCSLFQSMMHVNERYLLSSKEVFDFSKHKVFYNLVDYKEFTKYRTNPEEIIAYKRKLGIKHGDFVVGKIGRHALEKWSDLIIDMAPHLVKKIPAVKIVIIGCPPSRIKKIKHSRYRDFFIFLSETSTQKEVHMFYQTIDVLAHCSKIGECNGNTINEAMYWNKPVVVNSTPRKDNGQLEQVIHLLNGIIANNSITFARALIYLAKNQAERKKMGSMGFEQVSIVNNPEYLTKQLEKVFIEKLGRKKDLIVLSLVREYDKVDYYINGPAIIQYKQKYNTRLYWEFGDLSFGERLYLYSTVFKRYYLKLKDFIQHKWQTYDKR